MRTTSSLESMNAVIQRKFQKRTHIFKFVKDLRMHDAIQSHDLLHLSSYKNLSPCLTRITANAQIREAKIKYFTENLQNGLITIDDFLKAMSTKEILPPDGMFENITLKLIKS